MGPKRFAGQLGVGLFLPQPPIRFRLPLRRRRTLPGRLALPDDESGVRPSQVVDQLARMRACPGLIGIGPPPASRSRDGLSNTVEEMPEADLPLGLVREELSVEHRHVYPTSSIDALGGFPSSSDDIQQANSRSVYGRLQKKRSFADPVVPR